MKIKILATMCGFLFSIATMAQDKNKSDSLKVYGNCGMCKATIEGSLKKKDGVISKKWDKNTKILVVTYNPAKISLQKIADKVASAGYDNELAKAPDEAYKQLHECCQYNRPKETK